MESFLVYLFNFYYAISELEQNKQNNTIIFFYYLFFNKKVDLSSLRGVRAHPSHPPSLRACFSDKHDRNFLSRTANAEIHTARRWFQTKHEIDEIEFKRCEQMQN